MLYKNSLGDPIARRMDYNATLLYLKLQQVEGRL